MIIKKDIVEKHKKTNDGSRTSAQVKNFQVLNNFTYDHFYKHILRDNLYLLYNLNVRTLKSMGKI